MVTEDRNGKDADRYNNQVNQGGLHVSDYKYFLAKAIWGFGYFCFWLADVLIPAKPRSKAAISFENISSERE